MKPDLSVKVTFIAIAILLAVIAAVLVLEPPPAMAGPGARFDYIQVWGVREALPDLSGGPHTLLFDSRNGDLWGYSGEALTGNKSPLYLGKLSRLGQPVGK